MIDWFRVKWRKLERFPWVIAFLKQPTNSYSISLFRNNLISFSQDNYFLECFNQIVLNELTESHIDEIVSNFYEEYTWFQKFQSRRSFLRKALALSAVPIAAKLAQYSDVKSSDKSSVKQIDIKKLFEDVSQISQLKPARIVISSTNPKSPIIVYLQDVHGERDDNGTLVIFKKLEILRQRFGLNRVGLEGFSLQHESLFRKIFLVSAGGDELHDLVRKLHYIIIPLEEHRLHIKHILSLMIENYTRMDEEYKWIIEYFEKLKNQAKYDKNIKIPDEKSVAKTFECIHSHKGNPDLILQTAYNCLGNLFKDSKSEESDKKVISTVFYEYSNALYIVAIYLNKLYGIKSLDQKIIKKKMPDVIKEYNLKYAKLYQGQNENELRENMAVRTILSSMAQEKTNISVMVFGRSHTNSLIEKFIKQTNNNINIIVLEK